jgi:uncharacterized protein (TIGR03067 family)
MRATYGLTSVIALVLCLGGAAPDKPDADEEGPRGNWRYVSATEGAREHAVPDDMRLDITEDHWTTSRPGQDPMGGKYALNDSKRPRHIDLMVEEQPGHPIVQKGIYERDGDTLCIRFAVAGEPRPSDFKGNGSKGATTWVLKRVPDKPAK